MKVAIINFVKVLEEIRRELDIFLAIRRYSRGVSKRKV